MKFHISRSNTYLCVSLIVTLNISAASNASDYPLVEDVSSVDGVMTAYYDVVSGPAGFEYNPERDRSLYAPNAMITRFRDDGTIDRKTVAEETLPMKPWAEGFYEIETNRIVEQFGNLAHVWSTFETRGSPNGAALSRAVSSISLYYRDNRWWITSWSTQNETDQLLPSKYAPVPETE